ncbi:MAG: L,D-transpeptidase family protein [Candidatus Omnitrophica bacterium]|nr:L,D-transpeptidase family protein [Candidatus Omnitrophota bacterium]
MKKLVLIIGIIAVILIIVLTVFGVGAKISSVNKTESGPSPASLVSEAKELEERNELPAAKDIYQRLVNEFPGSNDVMNWQKKAEDINIKLLFSPLITSKSQVYTIKPGDTLAKIAAEFKTTTDLIKKSNNLSSDTIIPGRKIKVWNAPFSIVVDKSQNILFLKSGEEVVKTYIVATGKNNSTPIGVFKIVDKIPNPPWFKPGVAQPIPAGNPENILGTRWLALSVPSYGIHGTTEPQSLGKQVTQGCVRMANQDVEELYTIVPKGTEVTIVD